MMWSRRYWVGAVLLAGLWASPGVAQQRWSTFHFGGEFNDAQVAMLTSWINDTCRPDEMGHIAGFSYQEAPGKPLNLQVYCRQGGTGKLGKVKVVRSAYPAEFPLEISLSPLQMGDNQLVIAVIRDITERRAADAELQRARDELALVDDRERIARDLHDTVIQRLFAVGLSLQGALTRAAGDPAIERIELAVDEIDMTIRDIRSSIFALHTRRALGAALRDDVLVIVREAARGLGIQRRLRIGAHLHPAHRIRPAHQSCEIAGHARLDHPPLGRQQELARRPGSPAPRRHRTHHHDRR